MTREQTDKIAEELANDKLSNSIEIPVAHTKRENWLEGFNAAYTARQNEVEDLKRQAKDLNSSIANLEAYQAQLTEELQNNIAAQGGVLSSIPENTEEYYKGIDKWNENTEESTASIDDTEEVKEFLFTTPYGKQVAEIIRKKMEAGIPSLLFTEDEVFDIIDEDDTITYTEDFTAGINSGIEALNYLGEEMMGKEIQLTEEENPTPKLPGFTEGTSQG